MGVSLTQLDYGLGLRQSSAHGFVQQRVLYAYLVANGGLRRLGGQFGLCPNTEAVERLTIASHPADNLSLTGSHERGQRGTELAGQRCGGGDERNIKENTALFADHPLLNGSIALRDWPSQP